MDLSVLVPLYNESESLEELAEWVDRVCKSANYSYELLFVDDGSTDDSWAKIEQIAAKNPCVRGVRFRTNSGKSLALDCGFRRVKGDVVITMDADLQDCPDEIPALVEMIRSGKWDIVSGWKKKRHDSKLWKNIPSKLYNSTTRFFTKIPLHDMNCGLKAYRNCVVKNVELYGEMHRYIPVLAKKVGYGRITEKEVLHSARKYGTSKFGMSRFINGFLDLQTVLFVTRFGHKPMHFFGTIGTLMFLLGFLSAAWIGGNKLWMLSQDMQAPLVVSDPYFYIAMTLILLGSQLFLAGFIGELIVRNSSMRTNYYIEQEIGK